MKDSSLSIYKNFQIYKSNTVKLIVHAPSEMPKHQDSTRQPSKYQDSTREPSRQGTCSLHCHSDVIINSCYEVHEQRLLGLDKVITPLKPNTTHLHFGIDSDLRSISSLTVADSLSLGSTGLEYAF